MSVRRQIILFLFLGKSTLGNLLTASQEFAEGFTQASVTKEGVMKERQFGQRTLKVVDTPGFFDPIVDPRDVKKEIRRSALLVDPGPHAFLVLFKADRLSPEERACAQKITEILGPQALNWCILIITHSDYFSAHGTTFDQYNNSGDRFLSEVLIKQNFGGRFMVVNSKEIDPTKNKNLIHDLIDKITSMVAKNNGMYFENTYIARIPRTQPKMETMLNFKIVEEDRTIRIDANIPIDTLEQNRLTCIEQSELCTNVLHDTHSDPSNSENQASNKNGTDDASKCKYQTKRKKKHRCIVS